VTELEEIRNALYGESAFSRVSVVSWGFALAVRSFTRWPVDAWAGVRDANGRLRTLYWIQGNTLGQLTAEGDEDNLTIAGAVQPISKISAVRIAGQVNDDDLSAGQARRAVTVKVSGGDDITVDVAECKGHLRVRANEFIDALLAAVSKSTQAT
jgi:hypothetical protein